MTLRDSQGNAIGSPLLGETQYEHDYYSGSQITLMLGDVVLDTCVGLQYNVNQSKVPVYGYANQYYTFAADGKVLVSGAFTVAFKEAGYLFWPAQRFLYRKSNETSTSPRYRTTKDGLIVQGAEREFDTFAGAAAAAEKGKILKANVEQMMDWQYSTPREGSRYNEFWKQLNAMEDDQFEDWAEVFEDTIWFASDTKNPYQRDKLFSKNLQLKDFVQNDNETKEKVLSHRRADQYPSVDISITYGDIDRQAVNHTVKKILDLDFVGQAQQIEISGEPIYEVFHFIARNIV
jgi:hypothetical protein